MSLNIREGLTFDDVLLVPQKSDVINSWRNPIGLPMECNPLFFNLTFTQNLFPRKRYYR